MTAHTSTWSVLRTPEVPADVDHPDAWAVRAYSAIEREHVGRVWGTTDEWAPPEVLLPYLRQQEHEAKTLLAVVPAGTDPQGVADGDVAGAVMINVPHGLGEGLVWASLRVRPGAGEAEVLDLLLAAAEEHVRAEGRAALAFVTAFSPEPPPGPGVLEPPTGAGRVPADAWESRTVLARGYALEQVSRHSTLHLPVPAVVLERADALARPHAAGYRTLTWFDEVPEDLLGDVAALWSRMSTDAPSGGLDQEPETWDAARVRDYVANSTARYLHVVMTVAQEVATGALVAFTVVQVPFGGLAFGFQQDTLVLAEHRGHRLGTVVKVENLRALARQQPAVERLLTWNAQENEQMLAINVALGFEADGVAAVWQKRLG